MRVGRVLFNCPVEARACVVLLVLVFSSSLPLRGQAPPFRPGIEGEIYYCPRIDRNPPKDGGPLTIQLDGKLDEPAWQRAAFHGYTEYWKGGTLPTDESDCDPKWAAVADEHFLYVAWRIVDDVLQSQSTGCGIFNDDAIEIYIDGLNNGGGAYDLDDVQILVGTEQIGKDDPSLLEGGWVRLCFRWNGRRCRWRSATPGHRHQFGLEGWVHRLARGNCHCP